MYEYEVESVRRMTRRVESMNRVMRALTLWTSVVLGLVIGLDVWLIWRLFQ